MTTGTETQEITQEELDEIERLDREATPGPWVQDPHYPREINSNANPKLDILVMLIEQLGSDTSEDKANLRLVAIMRTLLPRLARAYRKAEKRLRHAHDAANKLHEAASFAIQDESERGPTIPQLIGWFRDLKSKDDYGMSEDLEAGCKDLEIVLAKLRSAIDPAEQVAALAEVQRRDALETDLANGHQAIEDLNQALDRSRAKLKDAYTRGRREAIEYIEEVARDLAQSGLANDAAALRALVQKMRDDQ